MSGVGDRGARFDPKLSQVGEKDIKRKNKVKKKCVRSGIRTHDTQITDPALNLLG